MRDIGKNIRDLRINRNMTQDELAEKLFVTRQTVSNYETGRSRPDIDMLERIAQALSTDPNTILYGSAPPAKKQDWLAVIKAVVILAAAYAVYSLLYNWFYYLAHQHWQQLPRIWLEVLGKPLLYLLAGWTVMQVLNAFHPVPRFQTPTGRKVKTGLFLAMAGYLLFMGTFLIFAPSFQESSPILNWGWNIVFYTAFGIVNGRLQLHIHLLFAFPMGILLWLCGFPKPKSSE